MSSLMEGSQASWDPDVIGDLLHIISSLSDPAPEEIKQAINKARLFSECKKRDAVFPWDRVQLTSVHLAVLINSPDLIRFLYMLGAAVKYEPYRDYDRIPFPPLIFACMNNAVECIKALSECGVNIDYSRIPDRIMASDPPSSSSMSDLFSEGWCPTAVYAAAISNAPDSIRVLHSLGASIGRTADHIRYPLSAAAGMGFVKCVNLLLELGADVKQFPPLFPPMCEAARNGHCDVISVLYSVGGADINSTADMDNATPVYLAALNGHTACLSLLHSLGADLNVRTYAADVDEPMHDPLSAAFVSGQIDCVHLLLDLGAIVDPEHFQLVCYRGQVQGKTDVLLHLHELKSNHIPNNGKGLIQCAVDGDQRECIYLLNQLGAPRPQPSENIGQVRAAYRGSIKVLRALLELGADPDAIDEDEGVNCVTAAALGGNLECICLLHDFGCDLDAAPILMDGEFDYPLQFLVEAAKVESVKLLIELGADVSDMLYDDEEEPLVFDNSGIDRVFEDIRNFLNSSGLNDDDLGYYMFNIARVMLFYMKAQRLIVGEDESNSFKHAFAKFSLGGVLKLDNFYDLDPEELGEAAAAGGGVEGRNIVGVAQAQDRQRLRLSGIRMLLKLAVTVAKESQLFGTGQMTLAGHADIVVVRLIATLNVFMDRKILMDILSLRGVCSTTRRNSFPVKFSNHKELPTGIVESFIGGVSSAFITTQYLNKARRIWNDDMLITIVEVLQPGDSFREGPIGLELVSAV